MSRAQESKLLKLNAFAVDLPHDRIYMQDVDAIDVEIWYAPVPNRAHAAAFMLTMDCQIVIDGFTTQDFDNDDHTYGEGCPVCEVFGWVNAKSEANCYRLDDIAMDAFTDAIAEMPELRMFKDGEHCIDSDHWTITTIRTESV